MVWFGFLVIGASLAVSLDRAVVAPDYAEAGTETPDGILYLGASNIGTDLLGDMVSATWLITWFGGLAAGIALVIAFPVACCLSREHTLSRLLGKLILRMSAGLSVWPLIGVIVFTKYLYEVLTTYAAILFALFVLPTAIYCLSRTVREALSYPDTILVSTTVWLRLWAAVMMLFAALSFFYSPGIGGVTLSALSRDNATLITFGDFTPLLSAFLMVHMAVTLRLWASIIEDRANLRLDPYADSWMFLPTILENELDERRIRKEYEGLH